MCRGKGEGGRRCPGCGGRTGLDKHNGRRRKNRAIRRHIVDWAREQGIGETDLAGLAAAPPKAVKEWAELHGLDPERFADGAPANPVRPSPSPPPAGDRGPVAGWRRPATGAPVGSPPARDRRGALAGAGGVVPPEAAPEATPAAPGWSREWWCTDELREQIQMAMDQQGSHRDERSLLSGDPERVRLVVAGTNTTVRIELDNGAVGFFKPFGGVDDDMASGFGQDSSQQSIHEVAAWRLANQMGPPWSEIVPPVVVREINGAMGSFALERPGRPGNWEPWHVPEWREAAFFDGLIGQQDRHAMNYLIAGDRLTLIDHGYSFARPGDYTNWSRLVDERLARDPALTYQEREALARLLASRDLLGVGSVLERDRAEALRARAQRMLEQGTMSNQY